MKLNELDTPTTTAADVVPGLEADSIHVARLPQISAGSGARAIARPPVLAFVTEEAPRARIGPRAALLLAVVVMVAAVLWVVIGSGTTGSSSGAHPARVHLTAAEQRAAAAARTRAAAIAQARRDRGTDALLQDTIPAATSP